MIYRNRWATFRTILFGILIVITVAEGDVRMSQSVTKDNLKDVLGSYVGSSTPSLQYVVVDADKTLFAYAGGWADIATQKPMCLNQVFFLKLYDYELRHQNRHFIRGKLQTKRKTRATRAQCRISYFRAH